MNKRMNELRRSEEDLDLVNSSNEQELKKITWDADVAS